MESSMGTVWYLNKALLPVLEQAGGGGDEVVTLLDYSVG